MHVRLVPLALSLFNELDENNCIPFIPHDSCLNLQSYHVTRAQGSPHTVSEAAICALQKEVRRRPFRRTASRTSTSQQTTANMGRVRTKVSNPAKWQECFSSATGREINNEL